MEDDPLNFIGGFHYAAALLAGGNTEAGEAYLRRLSELYSNLYQPYYLLSLSQAVRGLHKEALAAAEKAYSLAPWSTTTRGLVAGILRRIGEQIVLTNCMAHSSPETSMGRPWACRCSMWAARKWGPRGSGPKERSRNATHG